MLPLEQIIEALITKHSAASGNYNETWIDNQYNEWTAIHHP
jgi:hypothetical protein